MKKFLITMFVFLIGLGANADNIELFNYADMNMKNFWPQNGKYEEKILSVGTKIINANRLNKRIAFRAIRNNKIINAYANATDKTVNVYYGILPYIDSDDELAAVLSHEMAHCLDQYDGGLFKWIEMNINSKEYEFKADLVGIDLMVKAGYNPIAAISCDNKWMGERYWDFGVFTTHPKTSRRLMEMYKYIYRKYPWALQSEMIHNISYENFTYSSEKEINLFIQREQQRARDQHRGEI